MPKAGGRLSAYDLFIFIEVGKCCGECKVAFVLFVLVFEVALHGFFVGFVAAAAVFFVE